MYLHLGGGVAVPAGDIVGDFDLDNTTGSKITRDYLSSAEKAGGIVNAADDIPKSFVVCSGPRGKKIYLSQLSPATLLKRSSEDIL